MRLLSCMQAELNTAFLRPVHNTAVLYILQYIQSWATGSITIVLPRGIVTSQTDFHFNENL